MPDAPTLDPDGVDTDHGAVPLAVFCDFDGTFSVQDVGATLGVRYGGQRQASEWQRYERGEITPWEYNLEILDGLAIDEAATEAFLQTIDLDPGASALLTACEDRGVPFRILSDGFDWNLDRLQVIHGVRFDYTANGLRFEGGCWRIAPGAPSDSCGCGTGTCKGDWLRAYRREQPGAHLVHVGNGRVSDRCGAIEADTAFAKDSLATALAREGAPFERFETLHDVVAALDRLGAPSPDL
ncbi:MAG: haloacid dehalogenase-like hydrolase [Myxococcota bacterium]